MNHEWWLTSAVLYDSRRTSLLSRRSFPSPCTNPTVRRSSGRAAMGGFLAGLGHGCLIRCPGQYPDSRQNSSLNFARWRRRIAVLQLPDGPVGAPSPPRSRRIPVSRDLRIPRSSRTPITWGINHGVLDLKEVFAGRHQVMGPACSNTFTKMEDWDPFKPIGGEPGQIQAILELCLWSGARFFARRIGTVSTPWRQVIPHD